MRIAPRASIDYVSGLWRGVGGTDVLDDVLAYQDRRVRERGLGVVERHDDVGITQ